MIMICADGCSMIDRRMVSYLSILNVSFFCACMCAFLFICVMFLTNLMGETCSACEEIKVAKDYENWNFDIIHIIHGKK